MRIASLNIHPVKSGRGISLAEAELLPTGLAGDRRWMIVDGEGTFVSQRSLPMLARLVAVPTAAGLRLELGGEAVEVSVPAAGGERIPVRVWRDELALPEAPDASPWLSRWFGQPLRLVHKPEDTVREVNPDWGRAGDRVSLADGFPLLVTTAASLEAVRELAGPRIGMERFRPNIVIDGSGPWAEDGWARLSLDGVEIELVKPCTRCAVVTTDQERGVVDAPEVLKALRTLRRSGDPRAAGVLFGWNAVPRGTGNLRVGGEVRIVEARDPWPVARRPAD
jgi:uncharacterized protein YcbX